MKKINLLLVFCCLMFVFSACNKEPYIVKTYFIENTSECEIYLSKGGNRDHSSPFVELKQYDYEEIYSYFAIYEEVSSVGDFILKYKDKYYTITKENTEGPSLCRNYRRDEYLDYIEYKVMVPYNREAYVFTITDEFMESLTPDEE